MILFFLSSSFFNFGWPVKASSFYILFSTKERSVRFGMLMAANSVSLFELRLSFLRVFHPYSTLKAFQSLTAFFYRLSDTRFGSADTTMS